MRFDESVCVYVERCAKSGLSRQDIMRCLKRLVAREVYHVLTGTPATQIIHNDLASAA